MRDEQRETDPQPGGAVARDGELGDAEAPFIGEASRMPAERDRRGVMLPARSKVGGIITPQ